MSRHTVSNLERILRHQKSKLDSLIAEQHQLRLRREVAAIFLVQCKGFVELCERLQRWHQDECGKAPTEPIQLPCGKAPSLGAEPPLWQSQQWLAQLQQLQDQLQVIVDDGELKNGQAVAPEVKACSIGGQCGSSSCSGSGCERQDTPTHLWSLNWSPEGAVASATSASLWPSSASLRAKIRDYIFTSSCMMQ